MQDYVNEDIDLAEAETRLFTPIDEKIAAKRLDDVHFTDLWYSIIHSARRISFQQYQIHAKLADLVAAFKKHDIPGNRKYNYLYSSLTDFSMACREAYNDAPAACNGFFEAEVNAWANVNFFLARVVALGLEGSQFFAIYALRQALETPHQDSEEATATQQYDAYVPAAATWILAMGRDLALKEEDLTPEDQKQGNPGRGGELWKGKAEFSRERWGFWKERFATVGAMEDVREETRSVARDVVQHMERAETFERVQSSSSMRITCAWKSADYLQILSPGTI